MVHLIKKVNRLNKNENYYYIKEGKQVGNLYHVCTLDAFVNRIIEDNELGTKDNLHASGKYHNDLLDTYDAVSFTRDSLFVVPTWTVNDAHILFQIVIDGDKLSEHYKITPYNGNYTIDDEKHTDPKLFEKEEVVIGPIKNFKSYIKEVRFDIKSLLFVNTEKIIKDLKEVQEYLGSTPCKRKHLPFLQEDWSINYKKTLKEDDLYKVKTLDELITLLKDLKYIDVKDYIDTKELFDKYFKDLSDDQLTTLLKIHPKWINSKDNGGDTLLSKACFKDNIELAKLLLKHGADVNIKNNYGRTPLYWACDNNNIELVKLLLEHGADVNSKIKYGYTPLSCACSNNNIELAKLLLDHGADVNIKDDYGTTPLSSACYYNYIELAKLLLDHGADVNIKDKRGKTPLYKACYKNNTEIAKILLEHGADKSVNIENKYGETPLNLACYHNNIELVKLLLEHGAGKDLDVNNLPDYITKNKDIEDLVFSYLNKSRNESVRFRRLYRKYL